MTCKCKAQFCYICGAKWRTCACSDYQLDAILQAASLRRNAAQAEATARQTQERANQAAAQAEAAATEREAAELRSILEEIEQYETSEAIRLAAEEEGTRLARVEEKQRRHDEHILAISKRFYDLDTELATLHDLQRVAVWERNDAALARISARETTKMRHLEELRNAESRAQKEVAESERGFEEAYQARTNKQREIERNYLASLHPFWTGKPGGEMTIRQKMDEMRAKHAAAYENWVVAARKRHLAVVEALREGLENVRERQRFEMAVLPQEEDGSGEGEEADVRWRMEVEEKWVDVAMVVRKEMLAEIEREEYREFAMEE
jgi:hypothetical protein